MSEQCNCPPFDCAARVKRWLTGDRSAGEELYLRFRPLAWAIVIRVLGPKRSDEWEDACQAIFLRVQERLKTWEQRCPFCQWLGVVAARRAVDLRRQRHLIPLPEPADLQDRDPPSPSLDPDEMECIRQRVAGFSEDWRQVWELHLEGINHEEIGRRVGKSRRSIQYWLAEMREQLQQCLKDRGTALPGRR
jgi:RNA polymerase sigma factor (sigma-70 family)